MRLQAHKPTNDADAEASAGHDDADEKNRLRGDFPRPAGDPTNGGGDELSDRRNERSQSTGRLQKPSFT